jgi:hypothetical protein
MPRGHGPTRSPPRSEESARYQRPRNPPRHPTRPPNRRRANIATPTNPHPRSLATATAASPTTPAKHTAINPPQPPRRQTREESGLACGVHAAIAVAQGHGGQVWAPGDQGRPWRASTSLTPL